VNVVANNRGGGSWLDSNAVNVPPGFTTKGNSGTFTVTNITVNSADFNFPAGFDTSGAQTWQVLINGNPTGPSGSGLPPSTIHLSGLISNTQYSIRIQINEASCPYTVPVAPGVQFYTLPAAPTAGSFGTATASSLVVNWTDGSTNPDASTNYHLQYSANGGSTWTDFATNPAKSGSAESTTITGLTPETTYNVRVKTISASGNSANDSIYFQIPGTGTTLDTNPTLTPIQVTLFTSSAALSMTADNGGRSPLSYHWDVTANPAGATFSFTANDSGSANNTVIVFNPTGSYTVKVTVNDHNGVGPGTNNESKTFSPGQTPTTITINPPSVLLGQGGTRVFTSSVADQFGNVISGEPVTWSIGSCATLSGANPDTQITVTGLNVGVCQLTATDGSASGQATINVSATAPAIQNITINPNPVTGTTGVVTVTATSFNPGTGPDPLTFHWAFVSGPVEPDFAPNDSNATSSTATFHAAGTYTISCTATDQKNGQSTPANFSFQVTPKLQSINVCPVGFMGCPNDITIQTFANQQFVANGIDQFQSPLTLSGVQWTVNGGGSIGSQSGIFSSPTLGQRISVKATDPSGLFGTATVNLVSYDVSGAFAYPVPFKATQNTTGGVCFSGLGTDATIRIYTPSGRRVFDKEVRPAIIGGCEYLWPVQNSSGENVASGVYFYVIESTQGKKDGKLIIIQ